MKPRRLGRVAAADAAWRAEVRAPARAEVAAEHARLAPLAAEYRARLAARLVAKPIDVATVAPTLSIAEQERRYQLAVNPGCINTQDLRADLDAKIAAAPMSAAARAWIEGAYAWQDKSRRFVEVLERQLADDDADTGFAPTVDDNDVPHLERITHLHAEAQSRAVVEKPAARRRRKGPQP